MSQVIPASQFLTDANTGLCPGYVDKLQRIIIDLIPFEQGVSTSSDAEALTNDLAELPTHAEYRECLRIEFGDVPDIPAGARERLQLLNEAVATLKRIGKDRRINTPVIVDLVNIICELVGDRESPVRRTRLVA